MAVCRSNETWLAASYGCLPFVVKPELYRYFAAGIIRWQGAKSVDALYGAHSGNVERWYAAGLFHLDIRGTAVARNIESQIEAPRVFDSRVNCVGQPMVVYSLLEHFDV